MALDNFERRALSKTRSITDALRNKLKLMTTSQETVSSDFSGSYHLFLGLVDDGQFATCVDGLKVATIATRVRLAEMAFTHKVPHDAEKKLGVEFNSISTTFSNIPLQEFIDFLPPQIQDKAKGSLKAYEDFKELWDKLPQV